MLAAWIQLMLLITGVATAGMLALVAAPVPILKLLFGQAPSDTLGLLMARYWGLLGGLVGVLLIYAAYHAEVRVPALIVAIVEKAGFALGVFVSPFRRRPAAFGMALVDASIAGLYSLYLAGL
jgi:hypothetical protein